MTNFTATFKDGSTKWKSIDNYYDHPDLDHAWRVVFRYRDDFWNELLRGKLQEKSGFSSGRDRAEMALKNCIGAHPRKHFDIISIEIVEATRSNNNQSTTNQSADQAERGADDPTLKE